MARLLLVSVGLPKDVEWQGRTMRTSIWRHPADGPHMVHTLNIDGEGDLNGHGAEQRAVFVYQLESCGHGQKHFGSDEFEFGQFGENFTVEGLGDDEVCIADRYRIGEAEFEVTQPRVTCFRGGMRRSSPEASLMPPDPSRSRTAIRHCSAAHNRATTWCSTSDQYG
jgi:MOSC domain-containing protein YiiM